MVWDQTNTDPDIPVPHYSNVNPNAVKLYLEADNSKPLLIDKDGDGACDEVAKVESTNSIELDAIAVSHSPWYQLDETAAPLPGLLGCELQDAPKPINLCNKETSDMWQVIEDDFNGTPVIYGVSVSGAECTGVAWEFTTKLNADGWVCFAGRAVDNVGNVGISRPLRVCVDTDTPGTPACANSSTTPPTCTDGCAIPPRWGNGAVKIP